MAQHMQLQNQREGYAYSEITNKFIRMLYFRTFCCYMIAEALDTFFQFLLGNTSFVSKMCFTSSKTDLYIPHSLFLQKTIDCLRTGAATHSFNLPINCLHAYYFKMPATNLPNFSPPLFII